MISNFHGNSHDLDGGVSSSPAAANPSFGNNYEPKISISGGKKGGGRNKKRWFGGGGNHKRVWGMLGQQQQQGGNKVGSARSLNSRSIDSMDYSKGGDVSSFDLSTINTNTSGSTIFPMLKDDESTNASSKMNYSNSMDEHSMDGYSMDGYSMDGYSLMSGMSATSGSSSLMGERFLNNPSSSRGNVIPRNSLLGEIGATSKTNDYDDDDSLVGLGGDEDDDLYYDAKKGPSPSLLPPSRQRKVLATIPVSDSDSETETVVSESESADDDACANESTTVSDDSLVTISRKDLAQMINDAVEQRMIKLEEKIKEMISEESDDIRTSLSHQLENNILGGARRIPRYCSEI